MLNKILLSWIEEKIGVIQKIERVEHGNQSRVYKIFTNNKNYFLKISSSIKKESKKMNWLTNKLPVPRIIGLNLINNENVLLMTELEGKTLKDLASELPAEKIVDKLVEALHIFHAINTKDCPFGKIGKNNILVHGDACLLNFIFKDDELSGYIDLGDMQIDNVETDLAAAVWSLRHNLGSGHEISFLKKYGFSDADEELVKRLILQYENM